MRNKFDEQLAFLNKELISMGALCENVIASAAKALFEGNIKLAHEAIEIDKQIDQKEREIEALCLKLLLQQQPVARDLRLISAALKMITDMERIGDQAADICEIIAMEQIRTNGDSLHIAEMARATIKMVTESVDAFVKHDLALAQVVVDYDDTVDDLFNQVKNELIDMIRADAPCGEYVVDLLMIAKYFERIGDHAVNVAEWVAFSITGEHKGE
jgi:phosphate transport system protein